MVLGPVVSTRPGSRHSGSETETSSGQASGQKSMCCDALPNKRLHLTPNSSFQSIRVTVLAAGAVPHCWRSALLGAAEPHVR